LLVFIKYNTDAWSRECEKYALLVEQPLIVCSLSPTLLILHCGCKWVWLAVNWRQWTVVEHDPRCTAGSVHVAGATSLSIPLFFCTVHQQVACEDCMSSLMMMVHRNM
jgi:hypothetical protein